MGERTFRRRCRRYEAEGEAGLLDQQIGKLSGKRLPVDRCDEVEALYRTIATLRVAIELRTCRSEGEIALGSEIRNSWAAGQRGMIMKAAPFTAFIAAEPEFQLQFLIVALDPPTQFDRLT
jgi:hypothetical protein